MHYDLREINGWNGMKKDIVEFYVKCPNCQQVKVKNQKSDGLSQDISIPTWMWENVNINFIVGLPRTRRQHDSIWGIVDRMKKSAHYILVKISYSVEDYAKLYLTEMVKFHGVPLAIIFDRLKFRTTFHPQTDGQAECTIQILEDMLRACVIEFKVN
ncbi:hypothetical protein MTR67_043679 [Solanum verrucosum]|uniref:Integrase zinc-binding domain-containing protein n=1 Tax=Solanum verrucosum TaxID=315347 RepID=A0AAF0US37_SOLVR|nr:hypothetical protein MTR67_043679 [Solanum verrucosum]